MSAALEFGVNLNNREPGAGETAGFPRVPPSPKPLAPQLPLLAAPAMSVAATKTRLDTAEDR
jgi:hypothetical protein